MIRVALDGDMLIYAEPEPEPEKEGRASETILGAAGNGVIPVQEFGEYLGFSQRLAPALFVSALEQVRIYASLFVTPAPTEETLQAAARLASAHGVQIWDAVIVVGAERADARVLISEAVQDGHDLGGLRIANPFDETNNAAIGVLFPSRSQSEARACIEARCSGAWALRLDMTSMGVCFVKVGAEGHRAPLDPA